MLNNRFAGKALEKADRLYEAGITMNGQIVLCKGVNDGRELVFSIRELMKYLPHLESVSVVPVGLSKYREGLYPLEAFDREDAIEVLRMIHGFQKEAFEKYDTHFVHASDEWYLLAGEELPDAENYDGYPQLENGVGMLRLLLDEFAGALEERKRQNRQGKLEIPKRELSMATGRLAYPYILKMSEEIMDEFPQISICVYEIRNDFFGERITVSGLLTGQDLIAQLTGKRLGETLLLPENMLRAGESVFLDDVTVSELEKALQVRADIVKSSGYDFVNAVLGKD